MKRSWIIAAATVALAAPAVASANATLEADCDRAVITYFGFTGTWTATDTIRVDGTPVSVATRRFTGEARYTVPLGLRGGVRALRAVTGDATWGPLPSQRSTFGLVVTCGNETSPPPSTVPPPVTPASLPPVAPEPPDIVVVVPPPPGGPDLPRTCADLRSVGAGYKWLRRAGCVKVKRCPGRVRVVLKNGRVVCVAKPPPRRFAPPVTG